jgi:hypothetical protein
MVSNKTYVGFSDESHQEQGQYRAISIVTMEKDFSKEVSKQLSELIKKSGLDEFKWKKLRSARERLCAEKFVKLVVPLIRQKKIRIDTIIWEHTSEIKDDSSTHFQKMYYQLFKNVLWQRWPEGIEWELYPDEQSVIYWDLIIDFLFGIAMKRVEAKGKSELVVFLDKLSFKKLVEVKSEKEPIVQIADLFAGMTVFSYEQSGRIIRSGQKTLFGEKAISNSMDDKFSVLDDFLRCCSKMRVVVSKKKTGGLKTSPDENINFWLFRPNPKKINNMQINYY